MKLPDFKVEQWMNDYENDAIYNMTGEKLEKGAKYELY